jgi:hypothetical protein
VFGFHVLDDVGEAFRFILVLVTGVTGIGEELGESLLFRLEALGGGLKVGELGSEFLECDFKIPVFFLVFVWVEDQGKIRIE